MSVRRKPQEKAVRKMAVDLLKVTSQGNKEIGDKVGLHRDTVRRLRKKHLGKNLTSQQRSRIRKEAAIESQGHSSDKSIVALLSKKILLNGGWDYAYSLHDVAGLAKASRLRISSLCTDANRTKEDNARVGKRRERERKIEINRTPQLQAAIDILETSLHGSFEVGAKLRKRFPDRRRGFYSELIKNARRHLGLETIPRTTTERMQLAEKEFRDIVKQLKRKKNNSLIIESIMRQKRNFLPKRPAQFFLAELLFEAEETRNLGHIMNSTGLNLDEVLSVQVRFQRMNSK